MAKNDQSKSKALQTRNEYKRRREKLIASLVESRRQDRKWQNAEADRKRTEKTLQVLDAGYQALIEQIPVATYIAAIDEVGTTLYFSPQIEGMCGFGSDEWAPDSDLWFERIHPADRVRVQRELAHSHTTGEPFKTEYRMLTREGKALWFRDEATVINDENGRPLFLQGIMLDITERKRTEKELNLYRYHLEELVEERTIELKAANEQLQQEIIERRQVETALRESEQKFRNIVEQSSDGIVLINEQGLVIEWNLGQEALTGVKRSEVLGRSLWDVHCQVALDGKVACELIEGRKLKPDDQRLSYQKTTCLFSALCRACYSGGNGTSQPSKLEDYSDHRSLEQIKANIIETLSAKQVKWRNQLSETEIQHTNGERRIVQSLLFPIKKEKGCMAGLISRDITEQKLLQAGLIETEKLAALGRMAASLSHEINNPLQSVIGYLGLAIEELSEGEPAGACLQIAREEVRRIARIVNQMRNLHQTPSEEKGTVEVNDLLEQVLRLVCKRCEEGKVDVHWKPAAGLPPLLVAADPIRQLFLNLLLNAIEAMPAGGDLRVETRYSSEPAGVSICFIDSGTGISPEVKSRIFEPFYSTKSEGTGLGLFISHQIVEQQGGRITVESETGAGATFTVWLPV